LYKIVITSTKRDLDTEFWESDSDIEDYIFEKYISTGKLISADTDCSDNGLTKICEIVFKDKESYNDFQKDPVIVYQEKIKIRYNNYYRIAMSVNINETSVTRDLYSLYQH
jgi:hypothetical protein